MSVGNPRVLYVLGIYDSGTTVLSNLVGQLDGLFAEGELRNPWPKLTRPDPRCGCGEPLQTCPVWSRILKSALGEGQERVPRAPELRRQLLAALYHCHHLLRVGSVMRRR